MIKLISFSLLFLSFCATAQSPKKMNKLLLRENKKLLVKQDSLCNQIAFLEKSIDSLGGNLTLLSFGLNYDNNKIKSLLKSARKKNDQYKTLTNKNDFDFLVKKNEKPFFVDSISKLKEIEKNLIEETENLNCVKIALSIDPKIDLKNKNILIGKLNDSLSRNIFKLTTQSKLLMELVDVKDKLISLFNNLDKSILTYEQELYELDFAISEKLKILESDFVKNGPNGYSNEYFTIFPHAFPTDERSKVKDKKEEKIQLTRMTIKN